MDETNIFHSINTDCINALYHVHTSDNTHQQLEALSSLGRKLVENAKDPYLKQLCELQIELERAQMEFKHKKTVKVTSVYKSIMIADAINDQESAQESIANLGQLIKVNKDVQIRCIEGCINELIQTKQTVN